MSEVLYNYLEEIKEQCNKLNTENVSQAVALVRKAYEDGKRIFVAGNGGSAGTANHFSCDFSKNAVKNRTKRAKVITLSSNTEYITAIGNDIEYADIFSEQLSNLMEDGDLIILISASGNSPNILKAAEFAKQKNGKIIALTGFDGGKLSKLADVSINNPVESYEQAEDMHMIVLHMFVKCFKETGL